MIRVFLPALAVFLNSGASPDRTGSTKKNDVRAGKDSHASRVARVPAM